MMPPTCAETTLDAKRSLFLVVRRSKLLRGRSNWTTRSCALNDWIRCSRIRGRRYLVAQFTAFKSGVRRNDAQAQMRNMVRAITPEEIDQVATFYARKALPTE